MQYYAFDVAPGVGSRPEPCLKTTSFIMRRPGRLLAQYPPGSGEIKTVYLDIYQGNENACNVKILDYAKYLLLKFLGLWE